MDQEDSLAISDGLSRILQDAPIEAVWNAPVDGPETIALWDDLAANGFPILAVSDKLGGLGASIADIVPLAVIAGRFALPLPLVDTMLANALLSIAGLEPSSGPVGIVEDRTGTTMLVYAERVERIVWLDKDCLKLGAITDDSIDRVARAEDGLARVDLAQVRVIAEAPAPDWLSPDVWRGLGALMRAAAMSGAMQSVLELTLEHTSMREQFGRPLSKFQAIQHHLSDIASEAAAAAAAVGLAKDALAAAPGLKAETLQDIAVAKARCGTAAQVVSAASHQAHGAIGFTREYRLGEFTRRLWQWQDEFGAEAEWSRYLGTLLLQSNNPSLWGEVSR